MISSSCSIELVCLLLTFINGNTDVDEEVDCIEGNTVTTTL